MINTKRDSKKVLLKTALLTAFTSLSVGSVSALAETINHESVNNQTINHVAVSKHTFLDSVKATLDETWQSQDYEWYIPIHTWHNRNSYTQEQISEFNEQPCGLGVGKCRYDQEGDWHGLYAMAFLDSNNDWEPIAGYAFQKIWRLNPSVRLGLGYSVGVTLRNDMHYLPLPLIVPLLSIKYQSVALQTTYVPGHNGSGNVLFTWIRWEM